MQQLFPPSANTLAIVVIASLGLGSIAVAWTLVQVDLSSYWTRVGVPIDQSVPFSHEHHVSGLGIDCRYCHTTAATSPFAGIPPTETCMTCHSQVWADAPMLRAVRESFATGRPLAWNRVNNIPDFVYFDHSVHVKAGVSCMECHGRVDEMPLVWRQHAFHMSWCLDCHRDPGPRLSARHDVFAMPAAQAPDHATATQWIRERGIRTQHLADCTACHR